jgi:hypothetical protein
MGIEGVRMSFCLADEIGEFLPPADQLVGQEFDVPWDSGLVPARIEAVDADGQGGLMLTMVIAAPVPGLGEGLRLDLSHLAAAGDD